MTTAARADQYRSQSMDIFKTKTMKKTIERMEQDLKTLDSSPYAKALELRNLANAYASSNDYVRAIKALREVLETKSLSEYAEQDILFQLAQLYIATGQSEQVIHTLEKWLLTAVTVEAETYIHLSNAYITLKQYNKALTPLKKAIASSKQASEDWYRLLLFVHYKLYQFQDCADVLNKMIVLFPGNKKYWLQLSSVYSKMKKHEKALSVMELAYKKNLLTESKERLLLAQLFLTNGAPYKAGILVNEWIEKGRIAASGKNWEFLADIWIGAKEKKRAVRPLKQALMTTYKDSLVEKLCRIYIDIEDWQEAIDLINICLARIKKYNEYIKAQKTDIFSLTEQMPLLLKMTGTLHLLQGIAHYQLSEIEKAAISFLKATQVSGVAKQAGDWLDYLYANYPQADLSQVKLMETILQEETHRNIKAELPEAFLSKEDLQQTTPGVKSLHRSTFLKAGAESSDGKPSDMIGEKGLTVIGAIADGNEAGDLPTFEGAGELVCPEGHKKGDFLPHPYTDEKVLFRIDHTNMDKYKHRLTPGQMARLKLAQHYYMNIYPAHRNFEFPEKFIAATKESARTAALDQNLKLIGYKGGLPFPVPKNGLEFRYNADKSIIHFDQQGIMLLRTISPSGNITVQRLKMKLIYYEDDKRLLGKKIPNPNQLSFTLIAKFIKPSSDAGKALMLINPLDSTKPMQNWGYVPFLNKVKRMPPFLSDSKSFGKTATGDEIFGLFIGPLYQWNWKLMGKKELYIPANNYEMWQKGSPHKEECPPLSINPKHIRYELRRVWVIELTPKEGYKHPYGKRVRFYDEDTWDCSTYDNYDKKGRLFRFGEKFVCYNYCNSLPYWTGTMTLNLQTGHYAVSGGNVKQDTKAFIFNSDMNPREFTLPAFKRIMSW